MTHLNTLLNRCEELAEKLDDEFDSAKCRKYFSTMRVDFIGESLSDSLLEPWKAKFKLLTLDGFKDFYRDLHRELKPNEELQFSSLESPSPSTKG